MSVYTPLFIQVLIRGSLFAYRAGRKLLNEVSVLNGTREWVEGSAYSFFPSFFFFLSCYFSFSSYLVFFDTLWQLVQTEEPKKDPPDNLDRKSTCENAISSQCTIRPRRMEIVCFQSTSEAAKNVKHYLIWYNHLWHRKGRCLHFTGERG